MRPILFEIFQFPVPAWHFFFSFAVCAAYLCFNLLLKYSFDFQARRLLASGARELNKIHTLPLFLLIYSAGLLGARLFGYLTDPEARVEPLGPMTFYGGVLFGGAALFIFVFMKVFRRRSLSAGQIWLLSDCALLSLILGLAIGRLGCFFNADDYGRVVDEGVTSWVRYLGFFAMHDVGPGAELRYATQLQESLASMVIFVSGTLCYFFKCGNMRSLGYGVTGLLCLMASCANRFLNEFYRGDFRGNFFATQLSTSQGIALLLFFVSAAVLVFKLTSDLHHKKIFNKNDEMTCKLKNVRKGEE